MKARSKFRRSILCLSWLLGLFATAGCGPKADDYYGRGYVDGKKLGKSRRMFSTSYLPKEANSWSGPQRQLYVKGFRDGDAAQHTAEMAAQGIHFQGSPRPATHDLFLANPKPNQTPATAQDGRGSPVTGATDFIWIHNHAVVIHFDSDGAKLTVNGTARK